MADIALPNQTHVGRVSLQVADLGRSLSFYRDVIGFQVVEHETRDGRAAARLTSTSGERVLLELRERRGIRRVPPRGLVGLYHFAVLLPTRGDLGRCLVHAVNAGAQVASADHLVSEALYLIDPDGLTIEIYRDRPRDEWRTTNGELAMASLPLDTDAVVAAAGDTEPWRGLPAGTTIGHMHFYVGNLAQANEFYIEGLGFRPVVRSYPGALFVAAGGYHHHVGLNTWAAHMPTATADDAKLLDWELAVPTQSDADVVAERMVARGYAISRRGDRYEVDDPWGIRAVIVVG